MKSLSGMSAIELLVVIAIIGIIASIGYVSSRSVDTASVFRADREEFKSYLEEARFKAVSNGKHYKVLMQNSGDDITLKLYEPDSGNVKWRDLALNRRCGCYSGTGHSDATCNNAFSNSALSSLTSISEYDKTIDNIELVGCNNSSLLPFQELVTSNIGRGPNPLLQNHPLMAIHPPMLYIGYVGMTMPFVAATSRLYSKKQNANDWIEVAEKTTYIPWLFLTIGITLGAAWSYEVLGWGGYWAWDPVENVSFIPWLLATAFLHSAKIQKSQNTLLNWNYILVGLMFLSTIFGTFVTRSGVLISVLSLIHI